MRNILFLLPFLICLDGRAQNSSEREAVKLIENTQQELKKIPEAGSSCLLCEFTMAGGNPPDQTKMCEDLYGAACLDDNGNPNSKSHFPQLEDKIHARIGVLRDKTAVEMGYKNFDEVLKTRLKEAGLEVVETPDPKAWEEFKRSGRSKNNFSKLFKSSTQCEKDSSAIQHTNLSGVTDPEKYKSEIQRVKSFQDKYEAESLPWLAADIPFFINRELSMKCSMIGIGYVNKENNEKAFKVCDNLTSIRKRAAELYRLQGTPEYPAQAKKFIEENRIPPLKMPGASSAPPKSESSKADAKPLTAEAQKSLELQNLTMELASLKMAAQSHCMMTSQALENAATVAFHSLASSVNTSKTVVDGLISSAYTPERHNLVQRMMADAKADLKDVLDSFVVDTAKKEKINQGFKDLKVLWYSKPAESAYRKSDDGRLVLNQEPSSLKFLAPYTGDIFYALQDPELSFFTEPNANYLPLVKFGELKSDERVAMMPAFLEDIENNPAGFFMVLSHEIGHKIGPDVSTLNGHDLKPEYKDLLACYKSSKSIKMAAHQADETIADFVSAEVLSRQIAKLPAKDRKSSLVSAIKMFCAMDQKDEKLPPAEDTHPLTTLRVSGIFGAHPALREVMGCKAESSKYKTCGLRGQK